MNLTEAQINEIVGERLPPLDYKEGAAGHELQLLNKGYEQAQDDIAERLKRLEVGVDMEEIDKVLDRPRDIISWKQWREDTSEALSKANILTLEMKDE